MILRRAVFIPLLALVLVAYQPAYPQSLHVTADLRIPQTTAAMFGKLPKPYGSATVIICSNSAAAATIPLARIAQEVQVKGVTLLPRDAALAVIAASQGSSLGSKLLRGGMTAIELAAIAASWSTLSMTIKQTLTSSALVGGQALAVFSTNIPTHTYLTFDHEALPDPLQLPALGCATGIVVVETALGDAHVDTVIELATGTP